MAHLIDLSNHRANMAFVGKTPWHGLGQELTPGQPIEVWAEQAGMSHTIKSADVMYINDIDDLLAMPSRKVLYRSDNLKPLAVVSDSYQVVQPLEVLEFFRDLVAATGDYELETAGCLNEGKKYWALARYKESLNFGNDEVKPYLQIASSCDGTLATVAMHTSIRTVCNNTLNMGLNLDGNSSIRISHSTKFNADIVKSRLNVGNTIQQYKNDVEVLINSALSKEQAVEVFVDLVAKRDEKNNITNEKGVKKIVSEIMLSLNNAPGSNLETAIDTKWGALNALTHYVDFKAGARSANNRFNSGQYGAGAALKEKAFNALLAA